MIIESKVSVRLVPVVAVLYLINYLDRVNVGFAALTMNADLGLSAASYKYCVRHQLLQAWAQLSDTSARTAPSPASRRASW